MALHIVRIQYILAIIKSYLFIVSAHRAGYFYKCICTNTHICTYVTQIKGSKRIPFSQAQWHTPLVPAAQEA
jgi:hypothetical protein